MKWPEPEQRARWKDLYSGVQLAWAEPDAPGATMPCRNCAAPGPKPRLLDATVTLPLQGTLSSRLLECPACGCAFAQDPPAFDYEHNAANETSVAFYVEVGAGLWPITRAVARVEAPPGARYLEVGCGFGFALDYATRARGWVGRGIDPSPIAVAARGKLGLDIRNHYLSREEAAGEDADVVMAGEVVEHMSDPPAFIAILRTALKPGGTLVLTTPDRAALRRDAPLAQLVPILSVGAHVVLQTVRSLRLLLERAGFAHVEVSSDSDQLTAYASDQPLRLERSPEAIRRRFREYLTARVPATPEKDYVWWGFATRAHQEAVVDRDWDAAGRVWRDLRAECQGRFGFDLDDPATVPSTTGLQLWELPDRVPKALPGILYARALQRVGQDGASLRELVPLFRAAAAAAADLNEALRADASEDGATLGVERSCRAVLAAEAADAGREDAATLLQDAVAIDPAEATGLARRSLVGLVNAGQFDTARQLLDRWDVGADELGGRLPGARLSAAERDTLQSLAMLDLQSPTVRAHRDAVAAGDWETADRVWPELRTECQRRFGFDLDDPDAVPATSGLHLWELANRVPAALPGLLYTRALQRMAQHGASLTELAPMFGAAASAAARLNGALRTDASEDVATLDVERRCRAALAAEAADTGRANAVALLREAAEIDPARSIALGRRSFVGLVNAGQVEAARSLVGCCDAGELDARPPGAPLSTADRDTLHALAMVDLQSEGKLPRAAARFAQLRDGLPVGGLWWSAVRGECVAADGMNDPGHAQELLAGAPNDTMPDDLRERLGNQ